MTIEYKKRLSEAFYCHKLFWTMELIVQIVVIGLLWNEIFTSVFMAFSACLNAAMCFILVVLMFRTKSRTFDNLRPETLADYNQGESPYQQLNYLQNMNDLFISVKFTDKHAIRSSYSSSANSQYELIIKVKDKTFKALKTAADFR